MTTADRHARVKQLFLAVIELPQVERGPWLERACADDLTLRSEVESLLAQQTDESSKPSPDEPGNASHCADAAMPNDSHARGTSEPLTERTRRSGDLLEFLTPARPPGTLIAGRYRIVSELGRGGMGIVYRADDLTLKQSVAIKFLPALVATIPALLGRFRNEARLARTVTHPNVCRVHDIGDADGEHFITMEYVPGEDLAGLLHRIGRLPGEKGVDIARQVCAGLAAAHRAGVLHRDLKPGNILIDSEGRARITDFGIAGLSGLIAAREIREGTPAYMAPEQITGRDVSSESDIYSLGLVLYELFGGRPAFHAASLDEYVELQESANPVPLSEIVSDLPEGVECVVDRCLEKDPDKRPPSALHVAAALPGTDVLQLALASDVTPSPDLVAAASVRKVDPKLRKWILVAGIFFLASVTLLRSIFPLQWDDLGDSPPAALAERARRVLETDGLALPGAYEAFGFTPIEDAWQPMAQAFFGGGIADKFWPATAAEPCFFYRQSDRPLIATTMEGVFWRAGYVTPWDPPLAGAVSRAVLFDKAGRLIMVGVGPGTPGGVSDTGFADAVNEVPPAFIRAAGFEDQQVIKPGRNERIGNDDCTFWNISETSTTVGGTSACVLCTSPTGSSFFAVGLQHGGQEQPLAMDSTSHSKLRRATIIAQRALFLFLLAVAVPIGVSKFRRTRVDYRGAVRLAVFILVAQFAASVLRLELSATFYDNLSRLCMAVVRAAGVASLLGVFYLAVDAYARGQWPHLLVTWNRLMFRRFNDPDVRMHILVGVCVGCWWTFVASVERAGVHLWGKNLRPMFGGERVAEKLRGFASVPASFLGSLEQALIFGLLFLLLLVVIRTWIRHPIWAALFCAIPIAALVIPRGAHPSTAWLAMGLGGAAVSVWIMVRFGLLAMVVALLVCSILVTTPMSLNSHAWTIGISICAMVIVVSLFAYGATSGIRRSPQARCDTNQGKS